MTPRIVDARATTSMSVFVESEVVAAQRMAANALSPSSLERRRGDAAQHIHAVKDRLEVIDADAAAVSADVVECQAVRHWSVNQQPDPQVVYFADAFKLGLGVADAPSTQAPRADVARSAEVDLGQQSDRQKLVGWWVHRGAFSFGVRPAAGDTARRSHFSPVVSLLREGGIMQLTAPVVTIGWILAVLVLLLAILDMVGVLPSTPLIVFGLIAALAVARLL
jgi:hypothetical protein